MYIPDTNRYRVCVVGKTDVKYVWKNWTKEESEELKQVVIRALYLYNDTPMITEEEANRPATKEQIKLMKDAEEYYKKVSGHLEKEDYEFIIEQLDSSVDDGYTNKLINKLRKHI